MYFLVISNKQQKNISPQRFPDSLSIHPIELLRDILYAKEEEHTYSAVSHCRELVTGGLKIFNLICPDLALVPMNTFNYYFYLQDSTTEELTEGFIKGIKKIFPAMHTLNMKIVNKNILEIYSTGFPSYVASTIFMLMHLYPDIDKYKNNSDFFIDFLNTYSEHSKEITIEGVNKKFWNTNEDALDTFFFMIYMTVGYINHMRVLWRLFYKQPWENGPADFMYIYQKRKYSITNKDLLAQIDEMYPEVRKVLHDKFGYD